MAIDTRNKRASILGIGLAAAIVFPNPDGTIGQEDRQHAAYTYPGITSSIPYVVPEGRLTTREADVVYTTREP